MPELGVVASGAFDGYTFGMIIEQLRELHRRRPFQPFDIHLAEGRTLAVEHPEFLGQSPTGRKIAVAMPDDTHEIVDLLSVTSLRLRSNGAPKRRRPRGS